jgi:hypothetical protein
MRILVLLMLLSVCVHGDIVYEMTTTTEGITGMEATETSTVFYIKGECRRKETTTKNPMTGEVTIITITRLDKHVIWTLDIEHRQYTETKLIETSPSDERIENTEKPRLPEIIIETTEKEKEILDRMCKEVTISMKLLTEEDDSCMVTQTMWVSQDIEGYDEITEFNRKFFSLDRGQTGLLKAEMDGESFKKFQENIEEIEGFPLELTLDIHMEDHLTPLSIKSHSIVTKIETLPIHEKVFEIPEGFVLSEMHHME